MKRADLDSVEGTNGARFEDGLRRLTDPDRLVSDWQALLASHQHLHPPEAARMLDVPESALVAARIGSGSKRLAPNPDRLLETIADWGRVLCAFSNASGVHMPLGDVSASADPDALRLKGNHMSAELGRTAITDAYLFVDTDDSHGNTRSIQFFNAVGNTVLKVFIFHKARFEDVERLFKNCLSPNQARTITLGRPTPATFNAQAASIEEDPDQHPLTGDIKAELTSHLSEPRRMELELVSDHARVTWRGRIKGARFDDAMFHLHEPDIRTHLRYAPMTDMAQSERGALIINGPQGRLLRLMTGDK